MVAFASQWTAWNRSKFIYSELFDLCTRSCWLPLYVIINNSPVFNFFTFVSCTMIRMDGGYFFATSEPRMKIKSHHILFHGFCRLSRHRSVCAMKLVRIRALNAVSITLHFPIRKTLFRIHWRFCAIQNLNCCRFLPLLIGRIMPTSEFLFFRQHLVAAFILFR